MLFCALLFLFLTTFTFSSCEVSEETKNSYKDLLIKINLADALFMIAPPCSRKMLEARKDLYQAVLRLDRVLKGRNFIDMMSGSIERVEGENAGMRMLRIFRRDTNNPFAEKITASRMVKSFKTPFPKGYSGYEDEWSLLMDQGLIKFIKGPQIYGENQDLDKYIATESTSLVKQLVIDTFLKQGGVLENGEIPFSKYQVFSRSNVFSIGPDNYKNVFLHLPSLRFLKNQAAQENASSSR